MDRDLALLLLEEGTRTGLHLSHGRGVLGLQVCLTADHLWQFECSPEDAIDCLVAVRSNVKTLHEVVEVSLVLFVELLASLTLQHRLTLRCHLHLLASLEGENSFLQRQQVAGRRLGLGFGIGLTRNDQVFLYWVNVVSLVLIEMMADLGNDPIFVLGLVDEKGAIERVSIVEILGLGDQLVAGLNDGSLLGADERTGFGGEWSLRLLIWLEWYFSAILLITIAPIFF